MKYLIVGVIVVLGFIEGLHLYEHRKMELDVNGYCRKIFPELRN
tara:strand:+ start:213 stop:344 length:132 start_codon:yes stop_codon:yes gene_type:complete